MTATQTKVSTKTKVLVGVGLLALGALGAYGFISSNLSSTTSTQTTTYKPTMVMMKTADAPKDGKVSAGKSIVIGKVVMTSADIQTWGTATLVSMTVRASGSASTAAFKNWKLCNKLNTCVPGTALGSDITFSNAGTVLGLGEQSSLIKTANAQNIVELVLTVLADISSGYKGGLALSVPSTSSVNTLSVSNWTPTDSFISKAGLVGPNSIVGPSEIQTSFLVGPNSIVGPSESLEIGSIIIY